MAKYTKEEMLSSITPKDGYVGGEAREAAKVFTHDYDWEQEWEAFDPIEAMQDSFISGIKWALEHLK